MWPNKMGVAKKMGMARKFARNVTSPSPILDQPLMTFCLVKSVMGKISALLSALRIATVASGKEPYPVWFQGMDPCCPLQIAAGPINGNLMP